MATADLKVSVTEDLDKDSHARVVDIYDSWSQL